jgi:hypothetical protein
MGTAREPRPAKYFVALLSPDAELLDSIESELSSVLSGIDERSEPVSWTVSNFYEKEMGPGLLRRFVSFSNLRSPQDLAAIKTRTQTIEDAHRTASSGRRINLDPGYLDAFKIVLASTKNAGQRVYLQSGIYAEVTLLYHDAAFHGFEYTYRDYLWTGTLEFFTQLRARYMGQLRQLDGPV